MNALSNLLFAFLALLALIPALPAQAQDATAKPVISVTGEVVVGHEISFTVQTGYAYQEFYFNTSNGVKNFPVGCTQNVVGGVTCPAGTSFDLVVEVPAAQELWVFARTTIGQDIRQTEVYLPIDQGPVVLAFEEKEVGLSENSFAMDLYLQNLQGQTFATVMAHVKYNPNGLKLLGVEMTSSVPSGSELILNASQDGDLIFGLSAPVSGEFQTGGDILRFHFRALQTGTWNVEPTEITVDEGKFPVEGHGAQIEVTSTIKVSGTVHYGNSDIAVSGVSVTTDPDYGVYTLTDAQGDYSLALPSKSSFFSVRFSKDGDQQDAITAYDAALTARCSLGLETSCYNNIMDVTGNGDISLLDAREILRYVVGLSTTSTTGQWRFFGNEEPMLPGDADSLRDSTAWLMGDASMNWGQTLSAASSEEQSISLSVEDGELVLRSTPTIAISFMLEGVKEIKSVAAAGWIIESATNKVAMISSDGQLHQAEVHMRIDAPRGAEISARAQIGEALRLYVTNTVTWPGISEENLYLPTVIR